MADRESVFRRRLRRAHAAVMDPARNPLSGLPQVQRFQIMTLLSIMWTVIFSSALGAWLYFGELVVAHVLLLLGIFVTTYVFATGLQGQPTYRDVPLDDGTPRYNDVWGG